MVGLRKAGVWRDAIGGACDITQCPSTMVSHHTHRPCITSHPERYVSLPLVGSCGLFTMRAPHDLHAS